MAMVDGIDKTHEPNRQSWVQSANDPAGDFPVQNLPLGVALNTKGEATAAVAIGDAVLDLAEVASIGLLPDLDPQLMRGANAINRLLTLRGEETTALRQTLVRLLERGAREESAIRSTDCALRPAAQVELLTPTQIGSFTDFMAGIHHARAASRAMRGAGTLASTVRPSGATIRRPSGQLPRTGTDPVYAPSEMLDFELELGFFVGEETLMGQPVAISDAPKHIAGFCLLNDWSARDIQRWEMPPLGPFLAKNFATSISPWMVTVDALRPFRVAAMARPSTEPQPLPYLLDDTDQTSGALDIELAVWLRGAKTQLDPAGAAALRSNARHLYWTPAQMLAYHTSSGCDLQTGDLLGTGTISGPTADQLASLLEFTDDGRRPLTLNGGETRGYLQDGDEVTITGRCSREGYASIGFGSCSGKIVPA
jgi:fumarylacetoacetase